VGPTALAAQGFQACAWEQPFYLKFAGIATVNRAGQWLRLALASLFEHGHLALVIGWAATRTAGGADYG
jgi:hypothetical protein